jgi:4-cresol dehydrogenase (hydroxylating)
MTESTETRILPPGLTEPDFTRVVDAFVAALGAEAVVASPEEVAAYRDPYAFGDVDEFAPSLVVMPGSVEDVQAVVRVANELRVPLWTVSAGMNNAYGGPAPRLRGSVLVHLQRMNRVLEVNEELAYALVEPGVTFFDLYDAIQAGGHRLIMSSPDLGWGSVIGNYLERGWGYTPYGDHSAIQCGLEAVLANGEVIRTGMGAVSNGRSWQLFQHGFGPSADGIFKQSNFAIVTKMGVWLMPAPDAYCSCFLSLQREEDLGPLIETLRPLLLNGIIQNTPIGGNALAGAAWQGARRADLYEGEGAIPREAIAGIAEKLGVGYWTVRFGLYGPEEIVDLRLKIVEEAFSHIAGAELVSRKYPGDATRDDVDPLDRIQLGIPGLETMQMLEWPGGIGGHLDFSPLAPLTGDEVVRQYELFQRVAAEHGFDNMFVILAAPRAFVQTFMMIYDTTNEQQKMAAGDLYRALMREASKEGYTEYRTHVAFMDEVATHYGWNDNVLLRFNETLKDALDPNGILSPGKQGIWPKSMRSQRDG